MADEKPPQLAIPPRGMFHVALEVKRVPFGADLCISIRDLDSKELNDNEVVLMAFAHLGVVLHKSGLDDVPAFAARAIEKLAAD